MAVSTTSVIQLPYDTNVQGNLSATSFKLSSGCVSDSNVSSNAAISADKLIQQFPVSVQLAGPTTAITAMTQMIHIVTGTTGTLEKFQAAIVTKATDVSRTVSVDLQKSTGGGAFSSVLNAPISFTSSSANLTASSATITTTGLVAGDILEVVVTVAGAVGNQAQGLLVTTLLRETPT